MVWVYVESRYGLPRPTLLLWSRRWVGRDPGACSGAFFFQSGRCVPKPWNSPLCGMTTMCNFILHLEKLTVYYVCKIFLKIVIFNSLTTVQFLSFEKPIKVYIAVNTNRKPNISMKTIRTYITYFEIYFYGGFSSTRWRCIMCRNAECVQTMLHVDC